MEIGLCHEGAGVFVIGDKVLHFRQGDVTVITEHEPHFARSAPGTSSAWTWIWLNPQALLGTALLAQPESNTSCAISSIISTERLTGPGYSNIFHPDEDISLQELAKELVKELDRCEPYYRVAVRGLVAAVLCRARRRSPEGETPLVSGKLHQVGPALDYLARHFTEEIELEHLARLCGLSLTHFRRAFGAALGKPPYQYLLELRVHAAAAALQDRSKRVSDVAFDSGFATLSSFNRAFQAILGQSPKGWRRQREEVSG